MRKSILIFFILISNTLFGQNKEYKITIDTAGRFSHWTLSLDAGEIVPFSTLGNLYKNSISSGAQITYLTSHRFGIFFNPQYNFLSARNVTYSGTTGYLELVAGAKMFFGKFSQIFFTEAGLGDYFYTYSTGNYINGPSQITLGYFGFKVGCGANIPVSRKVSIFLKSDFHYIFSRSYNSNYLGLYGGLVYLL